jgi:hypothetical protein
MEVGPTGAQFGGQERDDQYAVHFNGREIVRKCVEASCEYVVIWARDGEYAYYDSKVMPKPPGFGERDALRETVEEAEKHRMPVVAYCVVQYGSRALRDHPEYRMVGPDGKPFDRVCFNTGYQGLVKSLLSEMLEYGIDGFHVDMLDQGFGPPYGCWCDACRSLFEKEYGRSMPKGVTWDEDWDRMLEFRYNTSARFEKALTEYVRSRAPGVTVDYNYHGNPPFSWEVGQRPVQHAGNGDFITGETGVWGFSALGVGLNARFYAAATPGERCQVAMQRGVRMYHDQTTRPLNDLRWELLTLLSHGTFVTLVDKTAYDGWLDPVGYQRAGECFREALSKREHFGQPVQMDVGIYFSHRTRDWYGREEPSRYFRSFQGAHRAMVTEHLPWGIVLDENVDLDVLRGLPVVCLPNAAILGNSEIALFRRYVEGGGNLIVTGQSGLYGPRCEPLGESALSELIGARCVGRLDSLDNHVRFPERLEGELSRLHEGIPTQWPFLVKGPAAIYEPEGAQALGQLLKPHRTIRQRQGLEDTEWPLSADSPVGPAVLIQTLGKGKVLTFATSPDYATASEHPVVEARKLLRNAVHYLHPQPAVRITAPANVEAVVTDDPKSRTLRVHLLGYLSPPATTPAKNRPHVLPSLIEDAPIFRATVNVGRPVKDVSVLAKTTRLRRDGSRIQVQVEDIHEVLVVEY